MQSLNTTPIPIDALGLAKKLQRLPDTNKAHSGKVLCIGGSVGMAGALLLTAKSALHSGAGYTYVCWIAIRRTPLQGNPSS
jgi:NAD(P)H-hydrate repair Nnr-like enzyme with NAD(P)H-hydrate dehydratase domain